MSYNKVSGPKLSGSFRSDYNAIEFLTVPCSSCFFRKMGWPFTRNTRDLTLVFHNTAVVQT